MREVHGHTSPSQHEADLRDLLRRSPLIVGRASEVPEPGRFFTHDETGVALLITRDETGRVRALLNVCSHRGTRLVYDTTGSATTFACRYHGWTYDLHGRLGRPGRVGLPPALEQFMGERALGEFPCETRHGFIWVVPTARTTLDVAGALGADDATLASLDLEVRTVVSRTTETLGANWKHVVASHAQPGRVLLRPNSLIVAGDDLVTHLEVFPTAIEESLVVHTRLARPAR
jgi:phenylpropionate dioxygenase-like ring-hydroxylating dioxygenase large terminal subunit